MMSWLGTLLIVIAGGYVCLLVFSQLYADSLLFQPGPSSYADSARILKIPAGDGTPLSAVHLVAPEARLTVLYFHGNAEDLGNLLPVLEQMRERGYSVCAFDYRGYGTTPGSPTEEHLYRDADAVYDHLVKQGVDPNRMLLYGRSVGSGPAVDLAARRPAGGLVIENGFVSAFRVVTRVPLLPADRFCNLRKLGRVRCPVLVIHARHDRTIPFWHGERLFAAAPEPKRSFWADAGHNDVVAAAGDDYWRHLAEFTRPLGR